MLLFVGDDRRPSVIGNKVLKLRLTRVAYTTHNANASAESRFSEVGFICDYKETGDFAYVHGREKKKKREKTE
jgi:hypothetical protein